MLIFHSSDALRDREGRTLWEQLMGGDVEAVSFDARHTEFVRDPAIVDRWTKVLDERLRAHEAGLDRRSSRNGNA